MQVHMPLFFLLSGFSCTLGYGKKTYKRTSLCCGPCRTTSGCHCEQCKGPFIYDACSIFGHVDPLTHVTVTLLPQLTITTLCFWGTLPLENSYVNGPKERRWGDIRFVWILLRADDKNPARVSCLLPLCLAPHTVGTQSPLWAFRKWVLGLFPRPLRSSDVGGVVWFWA